MSDGRPAGQLVEYARAGDRSAMREIYRQFAPRIYNFLFRMLGSREEAEDVTQQTFLIALREIGKLRDAGQLESWIYRIARNEVYQRFRRKKIIGPDSEAEEAGKGLLEGRPSANPERALLNRELGQVLRNVLSSLPLRMREAFVLAVVQEMSYKEICQVTGRSLLAVKTDIYRARLSARKELAAYLKKEQTERSER